MKKLGFISKLMSKIGADSECADDESVIHTSEISEDKKTKAEYHETLYAGQNPPQQSVDTFRFRNVEGIESTVDTLHHRSKQQSSGSDIERRVDAVLADPSPPSKSRKPANVIYVVSKPTPGQVRGDWAVRSHGKIFSHHRTKDNAIKAARQIAEEKEATVLVQNMDGTFRSSYKPRSKKD